MQTPNQIVDAAPAGDWVRIDPSDLVVMDLAPPPQGKPRRVVIQLMPAPFSQGWIGNIRRLISAHWYDEIAIVRVQDNYVVQWGDPDGEVPGKAKPLPQGLKAVPESEYTIGKSAIMADYYVTGDRETAMSLRNIPDAQSKLESVREIGNSKALLNSDAYNTTTILWNGWPLAARGDLGWPTHCYGSVGVGRNLSPDTGSGAELYAVIGHAPRQLDRNIAVVGRVIAGIENLSSLPRGTGDLGFYKTPAERTAILSVRMGTDVTDLPAYEYLSTESASFAAYADKRANRKDDFYIQPAGGVDICNVPVPIRAADDPAQKADK